VLSLVPGILIALILFVNEIPDRRSDAQAGKRTLPTRFSAGAIRAAYLVGGLLAFGVVVAGVASGVLPWPTLLALAAVPLVFRVHAGLRANYDSPYALMATMGTNVNLNLVAGGLLLLAYLATILVSRLA
jgi:1,4-dihydroxy-2-naphthoate octaprenyltransferase